MYYGSYSLPTYVTVWNADAFLLTTIVPVIIMILIDHAVLWYRLKLSPLKLLRRDFPENRKSGVFKPEDRNFFQVSPPGDLSEYQQLSGAVCGSCFCPICCCFLECSCRLRWIIIRWRSRRTCWRNTSTYFGSGKCLFRK